MLASQPTKPIEEDEMKAKDIIEFSKSKDVPDTMESRWRSGVVITTNKYLPPLISKEKAQLKRLGLLLGDKKFVVLDWALENWVQFASSAADEAGVKGYPANPNVGFLLKYHGWIINHFNALQKQTEVNQALTNIPVQTIAKSATIKEEPYEPSQEEIEALLEELK